MATNTPNVMRRRWTTAGVLAAALLGSAAQAQDAPLGGQPPQGIMPSVPDLALQVTYQRAFEAVVWVMPASAIYRLRVGMTEVPGMGDNVILAYSVPLTPKDEAITPNTVTTAHCRVYGPARWSGGPGTAGKDGQGKPVRSDR